MSTKMTRPKTAVSDIPVILTVNYPYTKEHGTDPDDDFRDILRPFGADEQGSGVDMIGIFGRAGYRDIEFRLPPFTDLYAVRHALRAAEFDFPWDVNQDMDLRADDEDDDTGEDA